jgi:hypothetical protein
MYNGIYSVEDIICFIAKKYIYNVRWEKCGQKSLMAEELGIPINELEIACDYFGIDLDSDLDLKF